MHLSFHVSLMCITWVTHLMSNSLSFIIELPNLKIDRENQVINCKLVRNKFSLIHLLSFEFLFSPFNFKILLFSHWVWKIRKSCFKIREERKNCWLNPLHKGNKKKSWCSWILLTRIVLLRCFLIFILLKKVK